ncbi:MAG: hypothetical protein M1839_001431 [Geoglossum umbratile]|nr:MAG: hypothetical protein M1839_001431 [Geoglossum umbratile]
MLVDRDGILSAENLDLYSFTTGSSFPDTYKRCSATGILRNVRKTARTAVRAPVKFLKAVPRWLSRPIRHIRTKKAAADKAQMLGSGEENDRDTSTEPGCRDDDSELEWIAADWRDYQLQEYRAGLKKREQAHRTQLGILNLRVM